MGLFDRFRRPAVPPAQPQVSPAFQLHTDNLIRGQIAPVVPRPRSVWDEGTGILDVLNEEPSMGVATDPVPNDAVGRIRHQYEHSPGIYAVNASNPDVEALIRAQEWDLVRYCSSNAADESVQDYTARRLIELHRFHDISSILQGGNKGLRKIQLVLPLLENSIDEIVRGVSFPDESRKYHFMNSILEHTGNTFVAGNILSAASAEKLLHWFHVPFRDEKVSALVMDAKAKEGLWIDMYSNCIAMFGYGYLPHWRYAIGVLDRSIDRIIADQRKADYQFTYGDMHILAYISESTSSPQVAMKALDVLSRMENHDAIKDVAANADHRHVFYDLFSRCALDKLVEVASLPRPNAIEIGKYAVDRLWEAGQAKRIAEVAGTAKLPEIGLYAQATMQG